MSECHRVVGSANGNAKLTEDDVRLIRALYEQGGFTYYDIADKFDVHFETIRRVIKRRLWAHVDD